MPVSYETCACNQVYAIPSGWTVFRCAVCRLIFDRDGSIWFPRSKTKVSE